MRTELLETDRRRRRDQDRAAARTRTAASGQARRGGPRAQTEGRRQGAQTGDPNRGPRKTSESWSDLETEISRSLNTPLVFVYYSRLGGKQGGGLAPLTLPDDGRLSMAGAPLAPAAAAAGIRARDPGTASTAAASRRALQVRICACLRLDHDRFRAWNGSISASLSCACTKSSTCCGVSTEPPLPLGQGRDALPSASPPEEKKLRRTLCPGAAGRVRT